MRAFVLAAVSLLLIASAPAGAQPTTMRVRGQVTQVEQGTIVVSTREGGPLRVGLAENYSVYELIPASRDMLTVGRYVGVVGERRADGRIDALAVVLFPESLRGSAEGQRPWDLTPRSTMTSATVSAVSPGSTDIQITVAFRGTQAVVHIDPRAPVVELFPAPRQLLGNGANVYITAAQMPDGTVTGARILVGREGLVPPL